MRRCLEPLKAEPQEVFRGPNIFSGGGPGCLGYETKTVCVGFQVYIRIWEVLVPFKYMFVLDITLNRCFKILMFSTFWWCCSREAHGCHFWKGSWGEKSWWSLRGDGGWASQVDGDTWLVTTVNKCPLSIGLWDPFQMALVLWLTNGGKNLTTYIHWEPILQVLGGGPQCLHPILVNDISGMNSYQDYWL